MLRAPSITVPARHHAAPFICVHSTSVSRYPLQARNRPQRSVSPLAPRSPGGQLQTPLPCPRLKKTQGHTPQRTFAPQSRGLAFQPDHVVGVLLSERRVGEGARGSLCTTLVSVLSRGMLWRTAACSPLRPRLSHSARWTAPQPCCYNAASEDRCPLSTSSPHP